MSSFNAKNHLRASAPQKKKTEFRIPPGRKQTTGHTKLTEQIKRFKSLFFASVKNNAPRGGLPIKRLLCVCFFFVLDLLVRIPTESVRVRDQRPASLRVLVNVYQQTASIRMYSVVPPPSKRSLPAPSAFFWPTSQATQKQTPARATHKWSKAGQNLRKSSHKSFVAKSTYIILMHLCIYFYNIAIG